MAEYSTSPFLKLKYILQVEINWNACIK